jgi:hypothetical protein
VALEFLRLLTKLLEGGFEVLDVLPGLLLMLLESLLDLIVVDQFLRVG